jgi:hypothetical protein
MEGVTIMKTLLCIDDTDNLESIGTGELLDNICSELEKKFNIQKSFISRHQLLVHEDIDYTSHNSSMCSELEMEDNKFHEILEYSKAYIAQNSAHGSDPGLCMVKLEGFVGKEELIAFGKSAKKMVLTKKDAYDFSKQYPHHIFLSEHGGTGDGVIGALAGCGLRLMGTDGKIKGKLLPENPNEILSVGQFAKKYNFYKVFDTELNEICPDDFMVSTDEIKAIVWEHKPAVILVPNDESITDGDIEVKWKVINKRELKKRGIGL